MASGGKALLRECRSDIQQLIKDLSEIENDVRNSGKGIGTERCAQSISVANGIFCEARNTLYRISESQMED